MADISDVLNALAGLVTSALYPNGTTDASGNAVLSVANVVAKVMRGSPFAKQLDDDLRAGTVNVTVNEGPRMGRTTTRFFADWSVQSIATATVTTNASGHTLTLGGSVTAGQGLMIIVDGQPYAYQFASTDTLSSIVVALAALVSVDQPALSDGPLLTIPGARHITARAVLPGVAIRPSRQQIASIAVKVFAPSFALRDTVAASIDDYLSGMSRVPLSDGTVAMLRYFGTTYEDQTQKALSFIRTLAYQTEYSTIETMTETTIGVMEAVLTPGAPGGAPGPVTLVTDVGPPIAPLPSDIAVKVEGSSVSVDQYGNPDISL